MNITICNTGIRQDAQGRYCLNDLHKAAGNEERHGPKFFMATQQAKELAQELSDGGIPPSVSIKGGTKQGTYVCKELVYAYAMWISAKFHLHVIRAFDAMVMGTAQPTTNNARLEAELMFAESAAKILRLPESGKLKMLSSVAKHHALPSDLIPDYAVDAPDGGESSLPTLSLSALLDKYGKPMAAKAMNKKLEEAGFLELASRKSSNGTIKTFWSITEKGLPFGKNLTNHTNQRETQPHWYIEKFPDLLKLLAL